MPEHTLVAYDHDGDPLEWCTHRHRDADEANECPWVPTDESLQICIVSLEYGEDFDPSAATPCLHGVFYTECSRCMSVTCVHLNDPVECERCQS
jgi:hypothetical protein